MPDWSRRQTLSTLAGGLAAALAGCRGTDSSDGSPDRFERRVENYEVKRVRDEDGAALFTRHDEFPDGHAGGYHHLKSTEHLAELTFADVTAARTLREFSADTDFEERSIYLFAQSVPACYTVELRHVEVDRNGPSAQFCRDLRPVDVECETDAEHTAGYAIRLPFTGENHSGMGSGMSSSCSRPPRPEPFDANVTLANGSDGR